MGISEGTPTILIMMGGVGGNASYEYAKKIGKMGLGAHILVVAGRNGALRKDIEELEIHPSNSMTVFGYTDRISDLMAISDLVVTKPGPGTINEAMAMKLPILIDNTDTSLFWERANVDMVMSYGVGEKIKTTREIKSKILSYLKDLRTKESLEQSFCEIPENRFHIRIKEIIEEMILLKTLLQELAPVFFRLGSAAALVCLCLCSKSTPFNHPRIPEIFDHWPFSTDGWTKEIVAATPILF